MKKSALCTLLAFFIITSGAVTQASDKTQYSVETDPATFLWDGYALHFRFSPASMPHWQFGAGVYSMVLPDFMVNMNEKNKDKNWTSDLQQGVGLFTEYYFDPSNQGWFVGAQLAGQKFKVSKDDNSTQSNTFTNSLIMLQGGYRWFPYGENLYIQPWAGLGYTNKISGSTAVGTDDYDIDPVLMFVTTHIGYRF